MNRRPRPLTKRQQGPSPAVVRLLSQGVEHYQAGRVQEAEDLYRKVLTLDARNPDCWHLLGVIEFQRGQHGRAEEMIREAIAIRGDQVAYHSNLGAVLKTQNKLEEALGCYERALALQPDYIEAIYGRGVVWQMQGKLEEAIGCQERVLELRPDHVAAHFNLGVVRQLQGRMDDAVGYLERALALQPDCSEALNNLGTILQGQGRMEEAFGVFKRALVVQPNCAESWNNLGAILQSQDRLEEATGCYERAFALKPDYVEACNNLGHVLLLAGKCEAAIAQYMKALKLTPDAAGVHFNLGNALQRLGKLELAIACYEQALYLAPDHAEACNNLGVVRDLLGDFDRAAAHFERALELQPDYKAARWNQSLMQLLTGDFSAGLRNYESRWGVGVKQHNFKQPLWHGEALNGARILLHAEQGLGDTLQFLRYVPMVQAAGGEVVLAVQPEVRRIVAGLPGLASLLSTGDPMPSVDWQCPLMSLPLVFGTTLDTIPAQVPYLSVPEEALGKAAEFPWPAAGLRVGLVWAGNATHPKNRYRSLPLKDLEPLLQLEGVHFFSLQMGPETAQVQAIEAPITELAPVIVDMADTAALIRHLDLVIAVDTSVVHLAGALGVRVWVMVPFAPDWRWLLDREDSPWYPSMRLFRQRKFGDWHAVVERMCVALSQECGKPSMVGDEDSRPELQLASRISEGRPTPLPLRA